LALNDHCGLTSIAIDKNIVHIPLLVFKEHILTDRIVSEVKNMASRVQTSLKTVPFFTTHTLVDDEGRVISSPTPNFGSNHVDVESQ
jgi:hypothetical protein